MRWAGGPFGGSSGRRVQGIRFGERLQLCAVCLREPLQLPAYPAAAVWGTTAVTNSSRISMAALCDCLTVLCFACVPCCAAQERSRRGSFSRGLPEASYPKRSCPDLARVCTCPQGVLFRVTWKWMACKCCHSERRGQRLACSKATKTLQAMV